MAPGDTRHSKSECVWPSELRRIHAMAGLDDVGGLDTGRVTNDASVSVVRETGLAVVHRGERISADSDSSAVLEHGPNGLVVNYYFPVEIVIAGSLPESER